MDVCGKISGFLFGVTMGEASKSTIFAIHSRMPEESERKREFLHPGHPRVTDKKPQKTAQEPCKEAFSPINRRKLFYPAPLKEPDKN